MPNTKRGRHPLPRKRRAPASRPTPPPPPDPLDAVKAALDAWYYPEVRALAAATVEEARRLAAGGCRSGDLRDEAEEWLRQTIDGHTYVIYTYQSQLAVAASEHSEDWREALGEAEQATDAQRAYYALLGDVWPRVEPDLEALVAEVEEREATASATPPPPPPDGGGGTDGRGES